MKHHFFIITLLITIFALPCATSCSMEVKENKFAISEDSSEDYFGDQESQISIFKNLTNKNNDQLSSWAFVKRFIIFGIIYGNSSYENPLNEFGILRAVKPQK